MKLTKTILVQLDGNPIFINLFEQEYQLKTSHQCPMFVQTLHSLGTLEIQEIKMLDLMKN